MNDTSEKRLDDDWLDDAIRSLLERAGSDAPIDGLVHGVASDPPRVVRPRWLAVAAALLVLVTVGSTMALRFSGDGATSSVPVLESSPTTKAPTPTPSTTRLPTTTTTAPAVPSAVPTTAQIGERQNYGTVERGQGIAVIKIPAIDVALYVVAGDGAAELAMAVGHVSATPAPGQLGNSVLIGHRTTYLAPFEDLDQLLPGDVIEIDTILGGRYVYRVRESIVVNPTDYAVVMNAVPGQATLSLITCTPKFTSKQRLVVRATLIDELSSPAGRGQVNYGQPGPAPAAETSPRGCTMIPPAR